MILLRRVASTWSIQSSSLPTVARYFSFQSRTRLDFRKEKRREELARAQRQVSQSEQKKITSSKVGTSSARERSRNESNISGISVGLGSASTSLRYENPLARRLAQDEARLASNLDTEGSSSDATTSFRGSISSTSNLNQRPMQSQSLMDPHSPYYQSLYTGEASLQTQEDYPMLESNIDHQSFLEESADYLHNKNRWYVAVVIDADQLLFHPELLRMGAQGAEKAMKSIQRNISKDLERDLIPLKRIRINCFCNLKGLAGFLVGTKLVTYVQFNAFLEEFARISPFTVFASGGVEFQAADIKVKAHLVDHVFADDCIMVYLGGLGDFGYRSELHSLRTNRKLSKVKLLNVPKYTNVSNYYTEFLNRKATWGEEVFITSSQGLSYLGRAN